MKITNNFALVSACLLIGASASSLRGLTAPAANTTETVDAYANAAANGGADLGAPLVGVTHYGCWRIKTGLDHRHHDAMIRNGGDVLCNNYCGTHFKPGNEEFCSKNCEHINTCPAAPTDNDSRRLNDEEGDEKKHSAKDKSSS